MEPNEKNLVTAAYKAYIGKVQGFVFVSLHKDKSNKTKQTDKNHLSFNWQFCLHDNL